MNTHGSKSHKKNNRAVAQDTSPAKENPDSPIQFQDQRSESKDQRNLIDLANNSHRVKQLRKLHDIANGTPPVQRQGNGKGLPNNLKSGIEQMSGYDMSGVKVNYNSSKPAQMQAHAYAQGNDIHLGPGQEKHLPHEAWHVVQQAQGRVAPTTQVGGQAVNDNQRLESEADRMGSKATQLKAKKDPPNLDSLNLSSPTVQRKTQNIAPAGYTVETALPEVSGVNDDISAYNAIKKEDENTRTHLLDHKTKVTAIKPKIGTAKRKIDEKADNILDGLRGELPPLELSEQNTKATFDKSEESLKSAKGTESGHNDSIKALQAEKEQLTSANAAQDVEDATLKKNQGRILEIEAAIQGNLQNISSLGITEKTGKRNLDSDAYNDAKALADEKKRNIKDQEDLKVTATDEKNRLEGAVDNETTDVQFAIDNHASLAKDLKNTGDAKVDAIITKILAAQPEAYGEKFALMIDLEFEVQKWLKNYTADGYNLKPSYLNKDQVTTDLNTQRDKVFSANTKLFTIRTELYKEVFNMQGGGGYTMPAEEESTSANVSSGSKFVGEQIANVGSGLSGVAGAQSQNGDKGLVWFQEQENIQVSGGSASKGVTNGLSIAGASVSAAGNIAGGIAGISKFISDWQDFNTQGNLEKLGSLTELGESVFSMVSGAASITKAVKKAEESSPKEGTSLGDMGTGNQFVTVTPAISESLGLLKNAVQTILAIKKMKERLGVDNQESLMYGLEGGMSLLESIKSAVGIAESVYEIIGKTVPIHLAQATPGLGLAIDTASAVIALFKAGIAGKQESELKETAGSKGMSSLSQGGNIIGGTQTKAGLKTTLESKGKAIDQGVFDTIVQEESRGVLGKLGGKNYIRFNAYILALIDEFIRQPNAGTDITIPLGNGKQPLELTKGQIAFIREYEYISKMQEVSQKKKVRGLEDGFFALVNVGAGIANLTGAGMMVGASIKIGTGTAKASHSLSKEIQKKWRNYKRGKLEGEIPNSTGNIKDFGDLDAYQAALGKSFGKGEDEVDKSEAQKTTEAGRHAIFVMESIGKLPIPSGQQAEQTAKAKENFETAKKMLKSTGVDLFNFLNAEGMAGKYKTIRDAIKAGDMG